MKNRYQPPKLEITEFTVQNVLALSLVDEGAGIEGDEP